MTEKRFPELQPGHRALGVLRSFPACLPARIDPIIFSKLDVGAKHSKKIVFPLLSYANRKLRPYQRFSQPSSEVPTRDENARSFAKEVRMTRTF